MAQKIAFNTLNAGFVSSLSEYNKSYFVLCDLKAEHRDKIKSLNAKLDEIKALREADRNAGLPVDEVTAKYSTVEVDNAIRLENSRYETACKPYNDIQKSFEKTMPNLSENVAKYNTTAVVTSDDKKAIREFFKVNGATNVDNDTALDKAIRVLFAKIGGMRVDNNKGHLKENSKSAITKKFCHAIILYLVVDRKAIIESEDGTLTLNLGK